MKSKSMSIEDISKKVSLEKDITKIQHLNIKIQQKDKRIEDLEDNLDELKT